MGYQYKVPCGGKAVSDRLTLATATGLPLLSLAFHVAMGVAALVAGYIAIAARKGGTWHRRSGTVFVYAMIAMALTAIGIALYKGKGDIGAGGLTVYLVFTAWTTVKPLPAGRRPADVALMLVAFLFAAAGYAKGFAALDRPGNHIDGVPAGMIFFMNTIVLLAAIGDARMIFAGGVQGTRRLARHLWRMCFGLFIASGSFVAQLAMMKGMPVWMRSVPVMVLLGSAPLVVLLYWLWRVRLRQNVRGLMTTKDLRVSASSALT
jgi:uncharacterized membrane protein